MPVTFDLVTTLDPLGRDFLANEDIDKFMELKAQVLGYTYADAVIPTGAGRHLLKQAPPGVVKSPDDGALLIAHLSSAFPNINFCLSTFPYPDATEARWRDE